MNPMATAVSRLHVTTMSGVLSITILASILLKSLFVTRISASEGEKYQRVGML